MFFQGGLTDSCPPSAELRPVAAPRGRKVSCGGGHGETECSEETRKEIPVPKPRIREPGKEAAPPVGGGNCPVLTANTAHHTLHPLTHHIDPRVSSCICFRFFTFQFITARFVLSDVPDVYFSILHVFLILMFSNHLFSFLYTVCCQYSFLRSFLPPSLYS